MILLVIPVLYIIILLLDYWFITPVKETPSRRERVLYRVLVAFAVLISIPTSIALQLDHVGASLSGLISLFTR